MGTGKTTVGRKVARSLGFQFVDTDDQIVGAAGISIPEIFAQAGEEAFRNLETEALEKCLRGAHGRVVATGGGIVVRKKNRELLKASGFVIWLQASVEVIIDRVIRNQNRPLVATDDPLETITKLLEERDQLYQSVADLAIETDDLLLDETVCGVTESARLALG